MTRLRDRGWELSFVYVRTETGADEAQMAAHLKGRFFALPFDRSTLDPPSKRTSLLRAVARRLPHASVISLLSRAGIDVLKLLNTSLLHPISDRLFSFELDELYPAALDSLLSELSARDSYNLVLVEYAYLSRAFLAFPKTVTRLLDTHDIFSYRHRLFLANNVLPGGFSTTPLEEKKALERSDIVIAIQEEEANVFRTMTDKPVIVLGHAIDEVTPLAEGEEPALLIVASANVCNARAVNGFIANVLVPLRSKFPELRLLLAGTICERVPERSGVEKLGYVREIGRVYERARLVVNPVQFGTGLKIKTVEALCHQKPLITSPHGASGIRDWAGRAFLVADDWADFRWQIEELLISPSKRNSLREGARQFASTNYLASQEALDKVLEIHNSLRPRR